jgi:hypothetical protein
MEYPLSKRWVVGLRPNEKLVWMTPNNFLKRVPYPSSGLRMKDDRKRKVPSAIRAPEKDYTGSSLDYIFHEIKAGRKLLPLMLDYTRIFGGYPDHEGRHRAFVAKMLGIKKVPVIVIR